MGENYEASSAEEENEMADLGFLEPISDEMDPLGMTGKIAGKPVRNFFYVYIALATDA